jgi:hypothetical protein
MRKPFRLIASFSSGPFHEIDGTRLIAEVNSKSRADSIRKKIETALGVGIRYRASEIQSPERMLADLRAAGTARGGAASEESERLAELPEVREKISEMMATHWRVRILRSPQNRSPRSRGRAAARPVRPNRPRHCAPRSIAAPAAP